MCEIFVSWEWLKYHEYCIYQVMDYNKSHVQLLLEVDAFKIQKNILRKHLLCGLFYKSQANSLNLE